MPDRRADPLGRIGWAWVIGVVGYALARAAVVWPTLGDYGVNPLVFLVIDVGTAPPYAVAQVRVVQEIRRRAWPRVQLWALVALVAFLAPYAYIVGAGAGEMPLFAYVVVGGLVVALGTASVLRIARLVRAPVRSPA